MGPGSPTCKHLITPIAQSILQQLAWFTTLADNIPYTCLVYDNSLENIKANTRFAGDSIQFPNLEMAPLTTFTTTVHPFPSPTSHACAYESGRPDAKNALVFIGGLGDGPHTVPYPRAIAKRLDAEPSLSYSVFEFRLKSSFTGFGFARLVDDVADISALVRYLRSIGKERIVLMGHSTGSQVSRHIHTFI
jgi:pimeloyl-ACP methyl ester carboxylesterase